MKKILGLCGVAVAVLMLLVLSPSAANAQIKGYVGGSIGTSFQSVSDYNNQWVMGIAGGVDWGFLRTELAYDRFQQGGGVPQLGRVDSNLVAAKLYLEHDFGSFTPYLMGGGGYSFLSGSGTNVSGPDTKTGFAWLAGAGFMYNLTKVVSIGLGYEYVHSAANVMNGNGDSTNWSAHEVKTILRINLN